MYSHILGKVGTTKEVFIAVCPINIARKNGIRWRELDPDKPQYSGVTGTEMDIIGQAVIKVSFTTMKNPKQLMVLVCKQQA